MGEHEEVTIGQCRLIRGDAQGIISGLPYASLLLTDPPYGIKQDKGFDGFGGFGKPIARRSYTDTWDTKRPDKTMFDLMIGQANSAIIFGGNFFADLLPVNGHWIVWDKLQTMPSFGDCELLWTNIPRKSVKKIVVESNGLLGKEQERWHPTQKPVRLLHWLVRNYTKENALILDPFAGSFSTAIACAQLGRPCIAIEIDQHYWEAGCRRVEAAHAQLDLYQPQTWHAPQQLTLA